MDQQTITQLLEKYAAGNLSRDEQESLQEWLSDAEPDEFHALLEQSGAPDVYKLYPPMPEALADRIEAGLDELDRPKVRPMRWRLAIAAAVVSIAAVAAWWMFRPAQPATTVQTAPFIQDVQPGGNKATLTLADGSVISLDEAQNGNIGTQGNVKVVKLDSGRLAYQSQGAGGEMVYNTLNTPRGGQFRITLPDGSNVWLNAASSLRFPASFEGAERLVELKGEAYFEVTENVKQPFKVKLNDLTVTVLGTSFNVMAYDDEGLTSTTLIEGAVRLENGHTEVKLNAMEEGRLVKGAQSISVTKADLTKTLAWKNGLFYFEKADINQIFRQLSRWYDVEPVYEGGRPQRRFVGMISRNTTLAGVLKILETAEPNVKFRIEGKKVFIKFN
ncbi:FecR family protein [Chitinophaga horti]|uniref:FecR family protein n=1 Tax=Chitinophaga horti TaxID=2920382 RepID=A0ABY6IY52_9BACT|nr:FecR family protein [Chitinophaga horti]UYQ91019.1 FecR family protein [Chitinophaga horti]